MSVFVMSEEQSSLVAQDPTYASYNILLNCGLSFHMNEALLVSGYCNVVMRSDLILNMIYKYEMQPEIY